MNANKLVIGLQGNDDIRAYLAKKSPGDSCSFEVDGTLDEMTPDQAVFSIKDTQLVDEGEGAPAGEEADESGEQPGSGQSEEESPAAVMLAMGAKSGKGS